MSNKRKDTIRSQFGPAAMGYETSEVHARGESLTYMLKFISPKANWEVLDVATGAGHTALLIAPHVSRVVATDLTEAMLEKTSELATKAGITNIEIKTADAEALPFDDASFDLVTCRLAFHHFPDPKKALSEFARVLRPNGILGLTDNITVTDNEAAKYYNAFEKLRDPSHNEVYTKDELLEMIQRAGFKIDQVSPTIKKELEFQEWADRQNVTEENKQKLLDMMKNIPEELYELFTPRWADRTMYFSLWETVIVSSKKG